MEDWAKEDETKDALRVLNDRITAVEGALASYLRQIQTTDPERPINRMVLELAAMANRGPDPQAREDAGLALGFVTSIND